MNLKPLYFHVHSYNSINESYDGYFLVFGIDTKDALERVQRYKPVKDILDKGDFILINQVDAWEVRNMFPDFVFTIAYESSN